MIRALDAVALVLGYLVIACLVALYVWALQDLIRGWLGYHRRSRELDDWLRTGAGEDVSPGFTGRVLPLHRGGPAPRSARSSRSAR